MEESEKLPDWVTSEQTPERPPETVILGRSNSASNEAPRQIYVQGQFGGQGVFPPKTNAVLALILGIFGVVMCLACTGIPGLILANQALKITNQYPDHPDHGVAKAAQVTSLISIAIPLLILLITFGIWGAVLASTY